MKTTFADQIWISIKIWLIAIAVNTLLGTIYLNTFYISGLVGNYLTLGTAYGAVYSFPVIVLLLVVINRAIAAGKNGLWLFRAVYITGIALTVIVFGVFCIEPVFPVHVLMILLAIAVVSGLTAIATQYKPLLRAGKDFQTNND